MAAHRSVRRAVGWVVSVSCLIAALFSARGFAQQAYPVSERAQIAALAERLAAQLLAANKKKPFILDLTLPGELSSPMGAWLADKISESLAHAHPELEVIPRSQWTSVPVNPEVIHDKNQEYAANESRAHALGAEVLVRGNFAAVQDRIGVTLMADDHISGGNSSFEALAEIPFSSDMQSLIPFALPERPLVGGTYKASMAGIGSPICKLCPAPEYTYVAKAKKLSGVVVLHVWVSRDGDTDNVSLVRAPNDALGKAAMHAVRNWRFKPATNASGEFVPVVVDVAVSFRLNATPLDATLTAKRSRTD